MLRIDTFLKHEDYQPQDISNKHIAIIDVMRCTTSLLTALENHDMLDDLTSIDLSSFSTLSFGFAGRFTAEMPLSCDFDYKVRSLEYVIGALERNETGLIDLTLDSETHFIPY